MTRYYISDEIIFAPHRFVKSVFVLYVDTDICVKCIRIVGYKVKSVSLCTAPLLTVAKSSDFTWTESVYVCFFLIMFAN